MYKFVLTLVAALLTTCAVSAQSQGEQDKEAQERIKSIKLQESVYYYGESSQYTVDSARAMSIRDMLLYINVNRETPLTYNDVNSLTEFIPRFVSRNGMNYVRGFAYMRKDRVPGSNATLPVATPTSPQTTTADVPANTPASAHPFVADMFVQQLMQQRTFRNVHRFLRSQKAEGNVLLFGKLSEVEDYSSLRLVVFDKKSEQIITVLSPVGANGLRTDLTSGSETSLDDYPKEMTAVIYYIQ